MTAEEFLKGGEVTNKQIDKLPQGIYDCHVSEMTIDEIDMKNYGVKKSLGITYLTPEGKKHKQQIIFLDDNASDDKMKKRSDYMAYLVRVFLGKEGSVNFVNYCIKNSPDGIINTNILCILLQKNFSEGKLTKMRKDLRIKVIQGTYEVNGNTKTSWDIPAYKGAVVCISDATEPELSISEKEKEGKIKFDAFIKQANNNKNNSKSASDYSSSSSSSNDDLPF